MTKLNDGANLGRAGQLCAYNFVRPIPEATSVIDAPKEVRTSVPIAILKDRLVDDFAALMERVDCRGDGISAGYLRWYLNYLESLFLKTFEIGLFVFEAKLY